MQEMNIYRKTWQIASILLVVVFIFAALQPVRSYAPYKNHRASYQNHLENLAGSFTTDWHAAFFGKSSFLKNIICSSVKLSTSFDINTSPFAYFLNIPTINAP